MTKSIVLPDLSVATDPVGFAKDSLGIPVKVLSVARFGGDGARLDKYKDGRTEIVISSSIDLRTMDGLRNIWHEIGHHLDEMRYWGGRGSFDAVGTAGRYSTPASELLKNCERVINRFGMPQLMIRVPLVGTSGKRRRFAVRSVDELLAGDTLSAGGRSRILAKQFEFNMKARRYLQQPAELFANAFGTWMVCPMAILANNADLARLLSGVAEKHGMNSPKPQHMGHLAPTPPTYAK